MAYETLTTLCCQTRWTGDSVSGNCSVNPKCLIKTIKVVGESAHSIPPHTHTHTKCSFPQSPVFTISRSVPALVPGSKRPEGDEVTMTSWERIEPHTSTLSQGIEQAGCISKDGHLCSLDCCCLACWRKSSPKRIMVASSYGKLKGKRKWKLQPSCLWL